MVFVDNEVTQRGGSESLEFTKNLEKDLIQIALSYWSKQTMT